MPQPTEPGTRPQDSRLGHLRRILTTGSGFLLFGVGAVLLSIAGFLPILLLPTSRQRKRRYSRRLLSHALRFYLGYFRFSGLIADTRFSGLERLRDGGQLLVASHPSLIDVLFLIALVPRANCIVKDVMWRNPVTIAPVLALGYIRNDSPDLVEQCAQSLRQGDSLIIFPEGTRSQPGRELRLLRGAANIALSAGVDMTPVVIQCRPGMLRKGQKWYQVPPRTPAYNIDIHPPIAVAPHLGEGQSRSIASRHLTAGLAQLFDTHYAIEPVE